MIYTIDVPGKVIGKKNAKKLCKRRGKCMLLAKEEWVDFFDGAMDSFRIFHLQGNYHDLPIRPPQAVHVKWLYYPHNNVRPDHSAICETVGDILEVPRFRKDKKTGMVKMSRDGGSIFEDDRQALNWDGCRIMAPAGKGNARLVISVEKYDPPEGELQLLAPKKKAKAA